MDTEVVSTSRIAQPLSENPRRRLVISRKDIARSPVKTVPELLRRGPAC